MAPMPVNKSPPSKAPTFLFSVADSDDSSPSLSSPPSTDAPKSQCSSLSEGEPFEGFGENEVGGSGRGGGVCVQPNNSNTENISSSGNSVHVDHRRNDSINNNGGVELELAPHGNSTPSGEEERALISRHSWARTSLRRTPTSSLFFIHSFVYNILFRFCLHNSYYHLLLNKNILKIVEGQANES
ncbi:uncharacterized protein LOC129614936 isoform X2 [Condylostylus longicornis]|uniref:uncharacterized protein LOC129614936 isoform X2 n=1 Tax=Condylostylus longicornis TaxID=2530218 RepID=UPI00244DA20A|nr:uncharacterized protein LOC129614936 isoform X2 [Condylostylus longicornis]